MPSTWFWVRKVNADLLINKLQMNIEYHKLIATALKIEKIYLFYALCKLIVVFCIATDSCLLFLSALFQEL